MHGLERILLKPKENYSDAKSNPSCQVSLSSIADSKRWLSPKDLIKRNIIALRMFFPLEEPS